MALHDVLDTIALSEASVLGLAFDGTYLWYTDGTQGSNTTLYKIELDGTPVTSFGSQVIGKIVYGDGFIWGWDGTNIVKIDPSDGSTVDSFVSPVTSIVDMAWEDETGYIFCLRSSTSVQVIDVVSETNPIVNPFLTGSGATSPQGVDFYGPYLFYFTSSDIVYRTLKTTGAGVYQPPQLNLDGIPRGFIIDSSTSTYYVLSDIGSSANLYVIEGAPPTTGTNKWDVVDSRRIHLASNFPKGIGYKGNGILGYADQQNTLLFEYDYANHNNYYAPNVLKTLDLNPSMGIVGGILWEDDHWIVVDASGEDILSFDEDGNLLEVLLAFNERLYDIAKLNDKYYVTTEENTNLYVFDESWSLVDTLSVPPNGTASMGITSGLGKLWMCQWTPGNPDTIFELDPTDASVLDSFVITTDASVNPAWLAWDTDRNLLVIVDQGRDRIITLFVGQAILELPVTGFQETFNFGSPDLIQVQSADSIQLVFNFGTLSFETQVNLPVSGFSDAFTFGAPQLNQATIITGLLSEFSFGALSFETQVDLPVTGFQDGFQIGNPVIGNSIVPQGFQNAFSFGSLVFRQTLPVGGIEEEFQFGNLNLALDGSIIVPSFTNPFQFGTPNLIDIIQLPSIVIGLEFGGVLLGQRSMFPDWDTSRHDFIFRSLRAYYQNRPDVELLAFDDLWHLWWNEKNITPKYDPPTGDKLRDWYIDNGAVGVGKSLYDCEMYYWAKVFPVPFDD